MGPKQQQKQGKGGQSRPTASGKGGNVNTTGTAASGGSKGKQAKDTGPEVLSLKKLKSARKAANKEIEAERIRERDAMMEIPYHQESSEEEDPTGDDPIESGKGGEKMSKFTTDRFGNTISKAKLAEDERVEALRAAARARRAEKEAAAAASASDSTPALSVPTLTDKKTKRIGRSKVEDDGDISVEKSDGVVTMEELQHKLDSGMKLSHKEKKAMKTFQRHQQEDEERAREQSDGLSSFSLSIQHQRVAGGGSGGMGGGGVDEDDEEQRTLSALDVIVPCFTITAPSRPLLVDASLKLVSGRRYGMLGANGRGKTTLLKFLAARRLPVPSGVDVLLVQQEVVASDVPVFEQVLAADTTRASLLKEEADLMIQFEEQEGILGSVDASAALPAAAPGAAAEVVRNGPSEGYANEQEHSLPPKPPDSLHYLPTSNQPVPRLTRDRTTAWSEAEWTQKLERFAAVGAQLEAAGADSCEAKVRRILTGLGFTEAMQEGTSRSLSGGWRMRVSLAQALFIEPKLLLLDEPTNHLDLNAVLWLDDYLSEHWKGTMLVVSHDADFLDSICTDMIHLDENRLNYYRGSFTDFAGMRGQIESKKELDYKRQQKVVKEFKTQGLAMDKAEKKAMQKLGVSMLLERPVEYKVRFTIKSPDEDGPSVDLLDVDFAYPGASEKLFEGLRFRVNAHSRIAVVGPNGAGKSTLLRLITEQLEPTAGEILRHSKIRIGRYDQHFEEILPLQLTPIDFLVEQYNIPVVDARKYLGMFGLDGARHKIRIDQLSGGQKARVVFASLSLLRAHILVLDEPTNHLDIESVEALIDAIKAFDGGVVLVSHDARLISATECELWVCGDHCSGLRVEQRGFEKYRTDVMAETKRQQQRAEVKAAERLRLRQEARHKQLQQAADRRSRAAVATGATGTGAGGTGAG